MVDKDFAAVSRQTEDQIKVLKGLEAVRIRPGMYVGGTDIRALHHLIYEVVDNSIDEALAGRCDHITVTLHPDNYVSVADNGGGIPVGLNRDENISTLELVLTNLHAGGKFATGAYKVSGGLHGVGVSAVNALSEELIAEIYRDGHLWRQTYRMGRPTSEVTPIRELEPGEPTGTVITFKPDFTVMDPNEFSYETLETRFREMAFVTRSVNITLRDERVQPIPKEFTFYFEGGLRSFVRYINRNRDAIHPVVGSDREIEITNDGKPSFTIGIEFAFQYADTSNVTELAFANTINTPDGGTHLTGLRSAITGVINRYARKAGFLKDKDPNFSGSDTLEGITAIVSIKHPSPSFESQTKVKLLNPETQGAVSQVVTETFNEFLELNPREARRIIDKCMTSMRAREAARKARDLVRSGPSLLESTTLPGKLADCSQHGKGSEVYIVEGDSAGGCFSGDTKVALADGRNLSFAEIVAEQAEGKEHFIYTIRRDGKIGIERAIHARITKRNATVIRVTLDNGEVITCTPDHRFMLRDGSYKAAEHLTPDDALMPLYRKLSSKADKGITIDGYEMVWNPSSDSWLFTHKVADWYNLWKGAYSQSHGEHCHHAEQLFAAQSTYWQNADNRAHQAERVRAFFEANPQARDMASEKAKSQWQDRELLEWRREKTREQWTPEFRSQRRTALDQTYYRKTIDALKRVQLEQGKIDAAAYDDYRLQTRDKSLLRFDTFCQRYFDGNEMLAKEAVTNYNHRVVAIERCTEQIDVYDLEVPGTHNFALASGVFVHNSAKQGRDRHFQAILPLRGKILNTERARLDKMLDNNEIKALISALGTGIGDDFTTESIRYERVIIMTDADVDGSHIRTLLLTFFFRHMFPLIQNGHLYIAQPPIFRIQNGKEIEYLYTEAGVPENEILNRALHRYPDPDKLKISRYKGLGEMNPDQLWETTMDPARRTLLQVTIEDAAEADGVFDMLMGSNVPPRRRFIQTHAKSVRNLDI